MKQHGMLFKGVMVNKVMDKVAPKTQTRRPITFSNSICTPRVRRDEWHELRWAEAYIIPEMVKCIIDGCLHFTHIPVWHMPYKDWQVKVYPRIRPGDLIWIKEKWAASIRGAEDNRYVKGIEYYADTAFIAKDISALKDTDDYRWRSSMLMPRWASRIDLLVLAMRSERVQEISEADAKAEGAEKMPLDDLGGTWSTYKRGFHALWDSINTDRGFPWAGNHPVWIHDFKEVEG